MKIIATIYRHTVPKHIQCVSLLKAIEECEAHLEHGNGWPYSITINDKLIWKQTGPFHTEDSLHQLKTQMISGNINSYLEHMKENDILAGNKELLKYFNKETI